MRMLAEPGQAPLPLWHACADSGPGRSWLQQLVAPLEASADAARSLCFCCSRHTSVVPLAEFLARFPMTPSNPPNAALVASVPTANG